MRALFEFLRDVFLQDVDVPSPAPADLTEAYLRELPDLAADRVLRLYPWSPAVRGALHAFKYDGARAVGGAMAGVLGETFGPDAAPGTLVTWIPGRPFQYFWRGYNPSRVLAAGFARAAGLPLRPLLRKTRATARQATLDREGRLGNVTGAFTALPAAQGAHICWWTTWSPPGPPCARPAAPCERRGRRPSPGSF